MSAKLVDITQRKPYAINAQGACSRLDPHPKLSPRGEHRSRPGSGGGSARRRGRGGRGLRRGSASRGRARASRPSRPGARQVLLGDDLVGVDVDPRECGIASPAVRVEWFYAPGGCLNGSETGKPSRILEAWPIGWSDRIGRGAGRARGCNHGGRASLHVDVSDRNQAMSRAGPPRPGPAPGRHIRGEARIRRPLPDSMSTKITSFETGRKPSIPDLHRPARFSPQHLSVGRKLSSSTVFGPLEVAEPFLPCGGKNECAGSRVDEHPAPNELLLVEQVGDLRLDDDSPHWSLPFRARGRQARSRGRRRSDRRSQRRPPSRDSRDGSCRPVPGGPRSCGCWSRRTALRGRGGRCSSRRTSSSRAPATRIRPPGRSGRCLPLPPPRFTRPLPGTTIACTPSATRRPLT